MPPTGPGWVFTISGYHYHNSKTGGFGSQFLAETVLKNLRQDEVPLPSEQWWQDGPKTFPLKKLGLGFPVLITVDKETVDWKNTIQVEDTSGGESDEAQGGDEAKDEKPARSSPGGRKAAADDVATTSVPAPRYDFTIQFCWQVPPPDTFVAITHLYPGDEATKVAAAAGNEAASAAAATSEPAADANSEKIPASGARPSGDNDGVEAGADSAEPDVTKGNDVVGADAEGGAGDGAGKAADAASGE